MTPEELVEESDGFAEVGGKRKNNALACIS